MLTAFKQHQQLNWKDVLSLPAFMGGGFLFGQLLMAMIFAIDGPDEWFPMSSLMAAILGLVGLFFLDGYGFAQSYRLALTMSRTRKPLLCAGVCSALLHGLAWVILTLPLMALDLLIGRLLYIGVDEAPAEFLLLLLKNPWILLLAVLPVTCATLFAGAIQSRVGRKVSSLLYVLFLCSINLISPIIDVIAEHPDSLIGRIFLFLAALPPVLWIVLGILLMAAMLFAALRMFYTLRAEI